MSTNLKYSHTALAVLALLAFQAPSIQAATLSSLFGSAYPGSTGVGLYDNLDGLSGSVEYAVFNKAAYEANFSASTVSVNPGELAYVYQILNADEDFVSQNTQLGINSSAVAIGSSTIDSGETSPVSTSLIPGINAVWLFTGTGNNIPAYTGKSSALVVTSTNIPNSTATQIIVNGGGTAFTMAVVPSDTPIPEPSSLALLVGGLAFLARRRR
jgi:hypothetical protein